MFSTLLLNLLRKLTGISTNFVYIKFSNNAMKFFWVYKCSFKEHQIFQYRYYNTILYYSRYYIPCVIKGDVVYTHDSGAFYDQPQNNTLIPVLEAIASDVQLEVLHSSLGFHDFLNKHILGQKPTKLIA